MSKKIERLQIALEAEIADHDSQVARLQSLVNDCATDQQRSNLRASWGMQERNQLSRISHLRSTIAYEIAAKATV